MKTKLLKKVRERYSIEYYPNGRWFYDEFESSPLVFLNDKHNSWRCRYVTINAKRTKEDCFEELYKTLVNLIQNEYESYGIRRNKIKREATDNGVKLWWK